MKILHMADIHAKDSQITEVKKCLGFIIETARSEEPDLIVVAGDTFDSRGVKMESESAQLVFQSFSSLADIAPVLVLAGTKSHEGAAVEVLKHIGARHPVCVSSHPEQICLCEGMFARTAADIEAFGRVDAVLSTLPTPTKQFFVTEANITDSDKEIANALSALFAGFGASAHEFGDAPHILVGHFAVGGAYLSETQVLTGREIEISADQIGLAGVDCAMLGHIHESQLIKPNIYYSGSIYRKDFGEQSPRGFLVHDILPTGRESHFVETPARKLFRDKMDFSLDDEVCGGGIENLSTILDSIDAKEIKDAMVRIELTTWQDEAEQIDRESVKVAYMDAGAQDVDVRIIRKPRANIRSEKLLKLSTLREKIQERAAINGEDVGESVLSKADDLEVRQGDEIVQGVVGL